MHSRIKAEIIAVARATPEHEVCGFIWHDLAGEPHLYPCANVSPEPACAFEISDEDHMAVLGRGPVLGVYHSHPRVPGFSPEDLGCAEAMGAPFYLYCVADDSWHSYLPPTYRPPLTGLPFVYGFQDCYQLVREWARQTHGHHMADYDRDPEANLRDLIMARFEAEGFEQVPLAGAQLGDVLMFTSKRVLSNHLGVLVGPNRMLHHPQGRLSTEEMLTGRWLERAVCAFRLRAAGQNAA